MADPFVGQIMAFGGTFAPNGWFACQGQLLSIAQYTALFSLLGTNYGGDGQTTFGLPDLRGRAPIGFGTGTGLPNIQLGQMSGSYQLSLTIQNMPNHNHIFNATGATMSVQAGDGIGTATTPTGNYLVNPPNADGSAGAPNFAPAAGAGSLGALAGVALQFSGGTISSTGGNVPVNIMNPYTALNWIIAWQGIYPSRP